MVRKSIFRIKSNNASNPIYIKNNAQNIPLLDGRSFDTDNIQIIIANGVKPK